MRQKFGYLRKLSLSWLSLAEPNQLHQLASATQIRKLSTTTSSSPLNHPLSFETSYFLVYYSTLSRWRLATLSTTTCPLRTATMRFSLVFENPN